MSSEDKDREVWGRYLAAYREAHPNAGIPGACLTIDALRVFERNARSSCAARDAVLEEAARMCELQAGWKWGKYKNGTGPERANSHTEGESDGADECARLIRAMKASAVPESGAIKEGK